MYGLMAISVLVCLAALMLMLGSFCNVMAKESLFYGEEEKDPTFSVTMTLWFFLITMNLTTFFFGLFFTAMKIQNEEVVSKMPLYVVANSMLLTLLYTLYYYGKIRDWY